MTIMHSDIRSAMHSTEHIWNNHRPTIGIGKGILTFVSILLLFLTIGCTDSKTDIEQIQNNTSMPTLQVKTPSFSISSPGPGELITIQEGSETTTVTLKINTKDLIIKSPGGPAVNGEGHFRVTLDDKQPVTVSSKTYTIVDVGQGEHKIRVDLLNNDKTPYKPLISKTVAFSTQKAAPTQYTPKYYTITINDFSYSPSYLAVKKTDIVNFVNIGSYPRSATCYVDGKEVFDTKIISPGKSTSIVMDKSITCKYYSATYPAMMGVIMVESNGIDNE